MFDEHAVRTLKFFSYVGRLKREKRTGWVRQGVKQVESVAEHMYMMAMMSMLLPEHYSSTEGADSDNIDSCSAKTTSVESNGHANSDEPSSKKQKVDSVNSESISARRLDKIRCMKMVLVHDLAECLVGDITPYCGVSREEKLDRETKAMEKVISQIRFSDDVVNNSEDKTSPTDSTSEQPERPKQTQEDTTNKSTNQAAPTNNSEISIVSPAKSSNSTDTTLKDNTIADEIMSLWNEYNAQQTPEATTVKDLDRFEMIFQGFTYEQEEQWSSDKLQSFFTGVEGKFKNDTVKEWVAELDRQREAYHTNTGE